MILIKLNRGVLQECQKKELKIHITFLPKLIDKYQFRRVGLRGICLKQDDVSFLHKKVLIYIYFL